MYLYFEQISDTNCSRKDPNLAAVRMIEKDDLDSVLGYFYCDLLPKLQNC